MLTRLNIITLLTINQPVGFYEGVLDSSGSQRFSLFTG